MIGPESFALHLPSIPKSNKTQFVTSYIHEQAAYAKSYATQGKAVELSWTRDEDIEHLQAQNEESVKPRIASELHFIDYGFGTPVLKPRVVMRPAESKEIPSPKDKKTTKAQKDSVSGDPGVFLDGEPRPKCKRVHPGSPKETAKSRQRPNSISDSEKVHEDRLKERRERKRAKRALMTKSDVSQDHGMSKSVKKKKKKDVKPRGPAGFALMHRFTATNVGTGRLTVKPSLNSGVFNKGKASAKSQPTQRKRVKGGNMASGFSENDFLDKTRRTPHQHKAKQKISSDSSISLSGDGFSLSRSEYTPAVHAEERCRKVNENDKNEGSETNKTTPSSTNDVPDARKAGSIIWDIELDGVELPSQSHPAESEAPAASVMVDTHNMLWGKLPIDQPPMGSRSPLQSSNTSRVPTCLNGMSSNIDRRASSSIGPSESASQCGRLSCGVAPVMETASKYFTSVSLPRASFTASPPCKGQAKTEEFPENKAQSSERTRLNPDSEHDPLVLIPIHDIREEVDGTCRDGGLALSTEQLLLVDPEDYKYSDYNHLWSSDVIDAYTDYFQTADDNWHGTFYIDSTEEDLHNHLSFHQWHELEGEPEAYEDERCYVDDGSLDGQEVDYGQDGYDSPEYDVRSIFFGAALGASLGNYQENEGTSNLGEDLCDYYDGNCEDQRDNLSCLGESDARTESDEPDDLNASRFTEGKALLLRYSESSRAFFSSRSQRPQVSLTEADVAKNLKNHWLPQRL